MSLDTLNPDIRDSVKEAARRAGMSVEQWVAATISDRAQRTLDSSAVRRRAAPAPIPVQPVPRAEAADELDAVAAKIARLAQGKPAPGRDLDHLLATASAETERRSRENAAKTAVALDAVARWIEGAETRIDQTSRATAQRQERTATVLGEALGLMTRRLEEIERKFESGHQPALDKALKAIERVEAQVTRAPAPPVSEIETALRSFEDRIAGITDRITAQPRGIGRRGLSARDELQTAVAEIRVRKAELDDPDNAPPRRQEATEPQALVQPGALDALRADIARLAGQLETVSRPSVEPAARAVQGELHEMQRSLEALATRSEVGALEEAVRDLTRLVLHARNEGGDVATVTRPIQELQAEIRRLSEVVTAGVHGRIAGDLQGLARKIDGLAATNGDSPLVADLARQFADLRDVLGEIAEPQRVAGLAEQITDLSRQVAQIGRSQVDALEFASLKAAVDEIRSHMRAAPRDGALQSAAAREIAGLSSKLDTIVDRLPGGDMEAFARMVEALSKKIDGVAAASAPSPDLSALGRRLDEIAGRLDGITAAPSAVSEGIRALAERMDTLLLTRTDPVQIGPIVARLDRLDESLRQPRHQPDLKPLEDMLRGLAERIDGGERHGGDPDGLDALERQVAAIAERLDRSGDVDPALSALQRAMGDLMVQVEGIRDDNYGLAERAAATAVASTLQTLPAGAPDLADFRRDMDDLKALHGATDRRNRDTLEAVHTTLEKLVERLASLETETARPRQAARPAEPKPQAPRDALPPEAMAALAQEAIRKIDAAARGGVPPFSLGEADRPLPPAGTGSGDEILLEPGARPRASDEARSGAQAASEMKAALIAQARRAAQAAAAQTAAASKAAPGRGIDMGAIASAAGGATGVATRVRRAIDKRRRPLLLGLAAIVLAIGTLQIVGGFVGGHKRTETASAPVRIEAPAIASPSPMASTTREVPARDIMAAPEPRPAEQAPVTAEGRERGAAAGPVRPAEPPRLASAEPGPLATSALPASPAAGQPAPPPAAAPEAPLGPIPNMASFGDLPAAAPPGLRQVALAGDPAAVYELASRAAEGRGMARDPRLAARLFERAAAHGLVPAQFRIGNHYEKGIGVTKDAALAKAWYQRAAEKGNARAMHNLAVLIAEGAGAKPDYEAAVDWFRRAAEHGVRDSQFNLAVLLARGLGTKQDLPGAFTWFSVAAGQGDEDAGKKRDEVAARLNAGELALARAAAERWRPEAPARTANEVSLPANGWSEAPAKPTKKI
ncbi:SEL1-like repeat protein [Salinarimonas soli]|uniref:Localization factor PodJL n=1 Tax=Salinarimonas soli TaxID=1638099 RepID=A0A5B2VTX3_9HYPH|nr:SEL1-like repeat protein [Salinarimonas soli]KAA2242058.1 hypothetical protein F0L46_03590 [Salinarimonas soli]